MRLEEVLHKQTLPTNRDRWHIIVQGHFDELLEVLDLISNHDQEVIQSAEWLAEDQLLICLHWIDDVMPKFVTVDIRGVSDHVSIKYNGRGPRHGYVL